MGDLVFKGWFEKTPDKWDIFRMKNIMKPREGRSVTGEEELLSVTINGGVVRRSEYLGDDEGGSRSETLVGYKLVEPNNLVNNIMKMSFRCLGVSKHTGIVSPAYSVFDLNQDRVSPQYLDYLLRTDRYVCEYRKLSKGIQESRMRLYDDYFLSMKVVVPPLEEQKLISRYLDKKTEQIDFLIEKIQKKIELLKEKRTSLINQFVTKGLDPNVEMKDSGVEWIGEIPSHWNSLPVRYVTEDHRQGFYTSDPYDDEGVPILRITDIQEDHFFSHWDSPKYSRPEEEIDKFYVKNGDFLFPRTGGVGRFGIVDFDFPCIYGSFMIRFRWDHSVNQNYMRFFLESNLFTDQVKQEIHGGVNQNVHVENIKDVLFFRPTLEEQTYISDYLQKKCSVLEKRISLEKKRSSLLQEYRQSLISSVVTGKVRVAEDMI